MAGAYTAKPAIIVAVDVPPGWNINWPHPGPWPPGYTPTLALGLVTQATVSPGAVVTDIVSTLTDQVDFATTEPSANINWSSAWNDSSEPLTLKLDGGEDFLASVSISFTEAGDDFWGADPDLEFDVSAADNGRSFTLTAVSTPFSQYPDISVTAMSVITVAIEAPPRRATYTISYSGSVSDGSFYFEMDVERFDSLSSPFDPTGWPRPAASNSAMAWTAHYDGDGGAADQGGEVHDECSISFPNSNTAVVTIDPVVEGKFYALWFFPDFQGSGPESSGQLTIESELFSDGELVDTASRSYTDNLEEHFSEVGWVVLDADSETLTAQ